LAGQSFLQLHENVQTLRPKLWRRKNWLLHYDSASSHTSFFTMKLFAKNSMTVIPTHPALLFSQLKIKLKGRHFDTTEVIKAESVICGAEPPHRTGLSGCI
jgi:hypothetical protein